MPQTYQKYYRHTIKILCTAALLVLSINTSQLVAKDNLSKGEPGFELLVDNHPVCSAYVNYLDIQLSRYKRADKAFFYSRWDWFPSGQEFPTSTGLMPVEWTWVPSNAKNEDQRSLLKAVMEAYLGHSVPDEGGAPQSGANHAEVDIDGDGAKEHIAAYMSFSMCPGCASGPFQRSIFVLKDDEYMIDRVKTFSLIEKAYDSKYVCLDKYIGDTASFDDRSGQYFLTTASKTDMWMFYYNDNLFLDFWDGRKVFNRDCQDEHLLDKSRNSTIEVRLIKEGRSRLVCEVTHPNFMQQVQ